MSIALNNLSLDELSSPVRVPSYDRTKLEKGIVHIGVGNFHRAHQAIYLHNLFELGQDFEWGICGAGIKSYDQNMRNKLSSQDFLTTVVELNEDNITAQVCGAMIDFVDIDAEKIIATMAEPSVKIVSLTITEGGYYIDPDTGSFDKSHSEIQHDITHPGQPKTVFGIILQALKRRRDEGLKAFTVMSCDNIPHNGEVAKKAVIGLATQVDDELATWIEQHVTFPNSMVDCIAPVVTAQQIKRIENLFNIQDNAPVVCESFRQWVLEDKFVNGRPALEKVGVQFVDDVAPYELMKLRVLNGGHAALAYASGLLGIEFVHEAMQNTLVTQYLNKLVVSEVIPSLPEAPGIDANDYLEIIKQRFSNPEIKDTIERLYQDGSNRLPKFILPTIADNIEHNRGIDGLSLVIALWCRLCSSAIDQNSNINILDAQKQALADSADLALNNASAFIGMQAVFGNLGSNESFKQSFEKWLHIIDNQGIEKTLTLYINAD